MWSHRQQDVANLIEDHRYEIENHFSAFEFLKIYSESILDHDLDMNSVLQWEEISRKSDFINNIQRSEQEWKQTAEYAKFLVDFNQTHTKFDLEPQIDLKDFIAKSSNSQSATQESIFQRAMQLKN